jgi:hypothetical protein
MFCLFTAFYIWLSVWLRLSRSLHYFSIGNKAGSLVFGLISRVLSLTPLNISLPLNYVPLFDGSNYGY